MKRKTRIVGELPTREVHERLRRAHARALAKLRGQRARGFEIRRRDVIAAVLAAGDAAESGLPDKMGAREWARQIVVFADALIAALDEDE